MQWGGGGWGWVGARSACWPTAGRGAAGPASLAACCLPLQSADPVLELTAALTCAPTQVPQRCAQGPAAPQPRLVRRLPAHRRRHGAQRLLLQGGWSHLLRLVQGGGAWASVADAWLHARNAKKLEPWYTQLTGGALRLTCCTCMCALPAGGQPGGPTVGCSLQLQLTPVWHAAAGGARGQVGPLCCPRHRCWLARLCFGPGFACGTANKFAPQRGDGLPGVGRPPLPLMCPLHALLCPAAGCSRVMWRRMRRSRRRTAASVSCWARGSAPGWTGCWQRPEPPSSSSPAAACCLAARGWARTARRTTGREGAQVGTEKVVPAGRAALLAGQARVGPGGGDGCARGRPCLGKLILSSRSRPRAPLACAAGDDWDCYRPAQLALLQTLQRHARQHGGCWIVLTGDYHFSDIKVASPGSGHPYSQAYDTANWVTPIYQVPLPLPLPCWAAPCCSL